MNRSLGEDLLDNIEPPVDVIKIVFAVLICAFGLLGNLIAISVILILKEYKKSITHWYVLQLAIADSVFLLTLSFKVSEDLHRGWIYPEWMCKAKETILFLNYYASILFLMIMSIDRYIAVCHTFSNRAQKLRTQTSAFVIIICAWVISLLLCIPVMMHSFKVGNYPHCHCRYEFAPATQNATAVCTGERFLSQRDLELCELVFDLPQVDNGEAHCKQYDFDQFAEAFGFGSGFSGSGIFDIGPNFNGSVLHPHDYPNQGMASADEESEGNNFEDNYHYYDQIENGHISGNVELPSSIPDACHYWDQLIGWKIFILFNLVVMFVLPLLTMVICYGLIVQRVSASHIRSLSSSNFSKSSVKNPNSPSKKSNSLSNADRKRVTITCAVLVSCFLILWLPFHMVHAAKLIGINATEDFCVSIPKIAALLAYLNSAINPYLYSFLGTNLTRKWKLLKQSQSMKQLMPIRGWRQQSNRSSTDSRRLKKTTLPQSPSSSKIYHPSSIRSQNRPTLVTRVANDTITSQQETPSVIHTVDLANEKQPNNIQDYAATKYSSKGSDDHIVLQY